MYCNWNTIIHPPPQLSGKKEQILHQNRWDCFFLYLGISQSWSSTKWYKHDQSWTIWGPQFQEIKTKTLFHLSSFIGYFPLPLASTPVLHVLFQLIHLRFDSGSDHGHATGETHAAFHWTVHVFSDRWLRLCQLLQHCRHWMLLGHICYVYSI